MFTLQEILVRLEQVIPSVWAEPWDNPGLQVGDVSAPIREIAVTLDITEESLRLAEKLGCDLIVSHHPLLFEPIKTLSLRSPIGRTVAQAIRSGTSLISLHTNWDTAPGGVNVVLSQLLGLSSVRPLDEPENGAWGIGAVGEMVEETDLVSFVDWLRRKWNLSWAKGYRASEKPIRRIALCGGNGSSLVPLALSHEADIFVTADMKYHQIDETLNYGINVCVVDHGEMESLSLPALADTIGHVTGLPVQVLETRTLPVPVLSTAPYARFR